MKFKIPTAVKSAEAVLRTFLPLGVKLGTAAYQSGYIVM